MWKCKICVEKDNRVSDLKQQIEFLKNQLAPSYQIPTINFEANKVLNGAGEEEPTVEEIEQLRKEKEERDALLSGNYN